MDGNDEFVISGSVKKGFTIRVIGGEGEDKLTDVSQIPEGGQKVIFYDSMAPTEISPGPQYKNLSIRGPRVSMRMNSEPISTMPDFHRCFLAGITMMGYSWEVV